MKIIQSLWTKPLYNNESALIKEQGRYSGGWLSDKYFYMAITLSVLSIKKYYPNVELYTDSEGKKLLIDDLKLPYSKVHVILDQFNDLPSTLWAIPKVYTYSIQDEPFVHVDNDIFFWDKILNFANNSELIVQNFEYLTWDYAKVLDYMYKNFDYVPDIIKNIDIENYVKGEILVDFTSYESINAGIFGGSDLSFIKEYTNQVFEVVNKNLDKINNELGGFINVVLEQLIFYRMANEKNKVITPYIDQDYFTRFTTLVNFEYSPFNVKYIHCLGDFKKNKDVCEQIVYRLKYYFPKEYLYLESFLMKRGDYINSIDDEKFLIFSNNLAVMENLKTIDDVLKIPLFLSKNISLLEDYGKYYIKTNIENFELNNWNKYLIHFEETSITGEELLEAIYSSDIIKSFDKNFIRENIIGTLCQHLSYSCFLTIER